ncbi:hypothetical protein CR513_37570, partial [Mucuna pruriens]
MKIEVHAGTLSMEIGDTLVQFNIFKAMKHLTEDHSLFGIDLIDELVDEYLQLDSSSEDVENFARSTKMINYIGSITKEPNYEEVHDLPNSEDNDNNIAELEFEAELFEVLDRVCNVENLECKQTESISDNKSENCVPSRSDSKVKQKDEPDSNLTKLIPVQRSWP